MSGGHQAIVVVLSTLMANSPAPRRYPYVLLDVFTRKPLEGNQLAVFTDARGLSDSEMQALAREANLCETTFIVPRAPEVETVQGVKVRIFTVAEELDFAGHPTLGTAALLQQLGRGNGDTVVLDLRIGKIPVHFRKQPDGSQLAEMRQNDPVFGQIHSREAVAACSGLEPNDIRDDVPIQSASTGMAFAQVPVRTLDAIRRIRLNWNAAAEYLARTDAKFFYFVSRETESPNAFLHARMIFYNGEDPATGSAAGCCAAWMVKHQIANSGEQVMVEQGLEIHRPSQIFVRAEKQGEKILNVRVGGYATKIGSGEYVF